MGEDLHELLGARSLPAYIGGAAVGCRLAMILALRRSEDVRGLLVARTGGPYAAERLTNQYYTSHIDAARRAA